MASGQKLTVAAGAFNAGNFKVFDCSLAGGPCVTFTRPPPVLPEWMGATVGTTSGATDTISVPLFNIQNALPILATNSSMQNTVTGEVVFQNFGVGTNRYNAATILPMLLSSHVLYKGAGVNSTSFYVPTGGFTGSWYFDSINVNGSGSNCNDNFNFGIQGNATADLLTNDIEPDCACQSWNSVLRMRPDRTSPQREPFRLSGIAFMMGGSALPYNSDNVEIDNSTATVTLAVSGVMQRARAFVFPTAGIFGINNVKGVNNKVRLGNFHGVTGLQYCMDLGLSNVNVAFEETVASRTCLWACVSAASQTAKSPPIPTAAWTRCHTPESSARLSTPARIMRRPPDRASGTCTAQSSGACMGAGSDAIVELRNRGL